MNVGIIQFTALFWLRQMLAAKELSNGQKLNMPTALSKSRIIRKPLRLPSPTQSPTETVLPHSLLAWKRLTRKRNNSGVRDQEYYGLRVATATHAFFMPPLGADEPKTDSR